MLRGVRRTTLAVTALLLLAFAGPPATAHDPDTPRARPSRPRCSASTSPPGAAANARRCAADLRQRHGRQVPVQERRPAQLPAPVRAGRRRLVEHVVLDRRPRQQRVHPVLPLQRRVLRQRHRPGQPEIPRKPAGREWPQLLLVRHPHVPELRLHRQGFGRARYPGLRPQQIARRDHHPDVHRGRPLHRPDEQPHPVDQSEHRLPVRLRREHLPQGPDHLRHQDAADPPAGGVLRPRGLLARVGRGELRRSGHPVHRAGDRVQLHRPGPGVPDPRRHRQGEHHGCCPASPTRVPASSTRASPPATTST